MKKILYTLLFICTGFSSKAQTMSYKDSLQQFINHYVQTHEVVKGDDKSYLQFFPANERYRAVANFEFLENGDWFQIPTSSGKTKTYRPCGKLRFMINDTVQTLYVYQSQNLLQTIQYKDYLFVPFTDNTTGKETYEAGRYLDLKLTDIKHGTVVIDFNKAYNPYCAYVSGVYSCPIPPKENRLQVKIQAGEKKYLKDH